MSCAHFGVMRLRCLACAQASQHVRQMIVQKIVHAGQARRPHQSTRLHPPARPPARHTLSWPPRAVRSSARRTQYRAAPYEHAQPSALHRPAARTITLSCAPVPVPIPPPCPVAACLRRRRCRRHARGALHSRSSGGGGGGGGCEQNEVAGQGEGRTVSKGGPASSSACDSCGRAHIGACLLLGDPDRRRLARRIG